MSNAKAQTYIFLNVNVKCIIIGTVFLDFFSSSCCDSTPTSMPAPINTERKHCYSGRVVVPRAGSLLVDILVALQHRSCIKGPGA